jgi:acyl phosphate:glycerol-3-phosphate acyltransferase
MTITWIILIVIAYFFGSIPLSYILAKRRGVDLSKQGTHQVGAGNLWRITSRKLGLVVGFYDLLKGIIMVGVAHDQGLDAGQQLVVGLAVIVGHNWPVFLRFHGGRGIATLFGLVIILPCLNDISPWPSVIASGFTLIMTIIYRSSPLPVLISVASLSLTNRLFGSPMSVVMAYLAIFLVVVIKRLTAQPAPEKLPISRARLVVNRLFFDRDIADKTAWLHRPHFDEKEILEYPAENDEADRPS